MTINATAMWLLALYQVVAEEQNPDLSPEEVAAPAGRHHPERHHQGVPLPRDLRLPARALAAADQRRDRLHGPPDPEVEPDQHLQLPPAGGRRDADAGARLRAVHRDRGARPVQGLRPGLRGRLREGRRPDLVLRQRRRPVRRGDCARCAPSSSCGTRSPASGTASQDPKMRRFRYGVQVNSLGLTEAQPENNVQRIVLEMLGVTLSKNARARAVQLPAWNEALGLPAAVGPAVVAAAAAGAGLRVRPAGVRRHLRRLARGRGQGRRAGRQRPRRDRPGPGPGRRDRGGRVRLHEGGAGQLARRPPRPDRVRRGEDRRGQHLRDHRAVAADRRPGRARSWPPTRRPRRPPSPASRPGRPSATRPRSPRRWRGWPRTPRPTPT